MSFEKFIVLKPETLKRLFKSTIKTSGLTKMERDLLRIMNSKKIKNTFTRWLLYKNILNKFKHEPDLTYKQEPSNILQHPIKSTDQREPTQRRPTGSIEVQTESIPRRPRPTNSSKAQTELSTSKASTNTDTAAGKFFETVYTTPSDDEEEKSDTDDVISFNDTNLDQYIQQMAYEEEADGSSTPPRLIRRKSHNPNLVVFENPDTGSVITIPID